MGNSPQKRVFIKPYLSLRCCGVLHFTGMSPSIMLAVTMFSFVYIVLQSVIKSDLYFTVPPDISALVLLS
jgi:hypothetical protein